MSGFSPDDQEHAEMRKLYPSMLDRVEPFQPDLTIPSVTSSAESDQLRSDAIDDPHKKLSARLVLYRFMIINFDSLLAENSFDEHLNKSKENIRENTQEKLARLKEHHSKLGRPITNEQFETTLHTLGKRLASQIDIEDGQETALAIHFLSLERPHSDLTLLYELSERTNVSLEEIINDYLCDLKTFNHRRRNSFLPIGERNFSHPSHYLAPADLRLSEETLDQPNIHTYFFQESAIHIPAVKENFKNVGYFSDNGSCIFLGKGFLATNVHVLRGKTSVQSRTLTLDNTHIPLTNCKHCFHPDRVDLAMIYLPELDDIPGGAKLSNASIDIESPAFTIGCPTVMEGGIYCSGGRIKELTRYGIVTTCGVKNGNSGGALINIQGNIIGIIQAMIPNKKITFSTRSIAIPIERLFDSSMQEKCKEVLGGTFLQS